MSEPFIGEIRMFAGNFSPRDWAFCDGQLLAITQFTSLFSIIGTTFGGDGRSTLALPNLKGRSPMGAGNGAGLTQRALGERGGSQSVVLNQTDLPAHTHALYGSENEVETNEPDGGHLPGNENELYASPNNTVTMNAGALQLSGGSQAHNNMQPLLTVSFIIALNGLYPSRS